MIDFFGRPTEIANEASQAFIDYAFSPFKKAKEALEKFREDNGSTPSNSEPETPAKTNAPGDTTTGQSATTPTNPSANADTASTSGVQQTDALSNNVNEGENKAKQTMTVQSGSDMGGVNYTNAGGGNGTTSSDSVMPDESATPQNQQYSNWMQNASTFGTSDENEKKPPLTLTKTVYWSRRKK